MPKRIDSKDSHYALTPLTRLCSVALRASIWAAVPRRRGGGAGRPRRERQNPRVPSAHGSSIHGCRKRRTHTRTVRDCARCVERALLVAAEAPLRGLTCDATGVAPRRIRGRRPTSFRGGPYFTQGQICAVPARVCAHLCVPLQKSARATLTRRHASG